MHILANLNMSRVNVWRVLFFIALLSLSILIWFFTLSFKGKFMADIRSIVVSEAPAYFLCISYAGNDNVIVGINDAVLAVNVKNNEVNKVYKSSSQIKNISISPGKNYACVTCVSGAVILDLRSFSDVFLPHLANILKWPYFYGEKKLFLFSRRSTENEITFVKVSDGVIDMAKFNLVKDRDIIYHSSVFDKSVCYLATNKGVVVADLDRYRLVDFFQYPEFQPREIALSNNKTIISAFRNDKFKMIHVKDGSIISQGAWDKGARLTCPRFLMNDEYVGCIYSFGDGLESGLVFFSVSNGSLVGQMKINDRGGAESWDVSDDGLQFSTIDVVGGKVLVNIYSAESAIKYLKK